MRDLAEPTWSRPAGAVGRRHARIRRARALRAAASLFAACWAGSACGASDARTAASVAERDSAGIEIVDNGGAAWSRPAPWRLSAEPALRLGVIEGDAAMMFDGITGVLRLGDGRIVVANSGSGTLRWYDAAGGFLFERGGQGEGPGEFSRLGGIARFGGDSIAAMDWSARRITMFGPDGELGATLPIQGVTAPLGTVFRLSDGTFIAAASGFSSAQLDAGFQPGLRRDAAPVLRIAADGVRQDTLGMFPGLTIHVRTSPSGGWMFGGHAFGASLSHFVAGDTVYIGTAERFTIGAYDADGRLLRSIRVPGEDLRLTKAAADSALAWLRSWAEQRDALTPEYERDLAEMPFPETRPAYNGFLVDDERNLWALEHRVDRDGARRAAVFDAEGRLLGAVQLPARFRPFDIAGGLVLGRQLDELDVESLVIHEIQR